MDAFERKNSDDWVVAKEKCLLAFKAGTVVESLDDAMLDAYMMGRVDAGEGFIFTDEKQQASLKIAETLIAFRNKLITDGGFSSGLADIITREHHMAMWSKDFINMTKEMKNDGDST